MYQFSAQTGQPPHPSVRDGGAEVPTRGHRRGRACPQPPLLAVASLRYRRWARRSISWSGALMLRAARAGCRQIGVSEQTFYRWKKAYGAGGGRSSAYHRQQRVGLNARLRVARYWNEHTARTPTWRRWSGLRIQGIVKRCSSSIRRLCYRSISTPTGQWSEPRSSGQRKASCMRLIAAGDAKT